MKYLVDTNCISEARHPRGHQAVRKLLARISSDSLFLSVITLGEIVYGISRLPESKARHELEAWLKQLETHFSSRVLPVNHVIARTWGELAAARSDSGRPLSAADGLIAATAIHHGLRLITRNTSDFDGTGVVVIDPTA